MSHLNSNENQTEANYAAMEMNNQSEKPSSNESRFNSINVLNSIRRMWAENGIIKLIIVAMGIFLSFFIIGILLEKMIKVPYIDSDGNKEKFHYEFTLIGVQYIFTYIITKVFDTVSPEEKIDTTHFMYYVLAAAANATASSCSYKAFRWVSYPMQVIFKSAKPLAVIILGLIICKKYPIQRYFFVLLIVTGVVLFIFYEPKNAGKITSTDDTTDYRFIGIVLLALSLVMDGILGAIQDRARAVHAPTPRKFLLGMMGFGTIYLSIILIATGEYAEVYGFIGRHPDIIWKICLFAVCGVVGQLFIYTMVACFGALACSITTTVRKFFSILFSTIYFGNPSTPLQWLGATLVFGGLFADAFLGKKHTAPHQNDIELTENVETAEKLMTNPEQKSTETKSSSTQQEMA
ncbi:solute carrier family 35 member B1 homolog [Sitodiplosis mosellana]|uniref:solute carrier family 35 member B1 homolog n=1 Tax=Sitodiplosis mosellana TaxID=263140 RepID=UPI002443CAA5|nr:solute carrier family 35 member B1 homolog [Sitodiplosis mosellana]XP_055295412.1 solute carrier family 35 member B1 homolog [Sitodiplosis mosellana]